MPGGVAVTQTDRLRPEIGFRSSFWSSERSTHSGCAYAAGCTRTAWQSAKNRQFGAVFLAGGDPSEVQNCAKSAQKRYPIDQISMCGPPHVDGFMPWDEGISLACQLCVCWAVNHSKSTKMIQNDTKSENYQVTGATKAGTQSARSWPKIKIGCSPSDVLLA